MTSQGQVPGDHDSATTRGDVPGDHDSATAQDHVPGDHDSAATRGHVPDEAVDLERRYRRLLLAYPFDYRELRAEEMVATLLEDAAPGQRRPTWAEAADLVVGGVRQRLRVPALPGLWVAAALSALIFAAVAGAAAAQLGWMAAGALPDDATVTRLVITAFGPQPGAVTTRRDETFGYQEPGALVFLGDDTYAAGYVRVAGYPDGQHSIEDAAAALGRAGWRVNPVREGSDGIILTATTARLALEAHLRSTDNRLVVDVRRAAPRTVAPLAVMGWIGGAIAGWMFAGVLARRSVRQERDVQLAMQSVVVFGLVLLFPATALATRALADAVIDPGSGVISPPWSAYMFLVLRPVWLLGMVFAIVAAGLATVSPPGWPRYRPWATPHLSPSAGSPRQPSPRPQ
jgi:hypothetical protein